MTPSGRADLVATRATAVGIGLIALIVTWTIGARLAELAWDAPAGPIVAICVAVVVGVAAVPIAARRLGSHDGV